MSSGSSSSGAPSESAADAEAKSRMLRLKELRQRKIELEKRQEAEKQQKVSAELAKKRELLLALRTLLLTTQRLGFLLSCVIQTLFIEHLSRLQGQMIVTCLS